MNIKGEEQHILLVCPVSL